MLVASDLPLADVEILKVGRHGSRTASSHDFLAVTTPEVAIYMAGVGNSYGHPHQNHLSSSGIGARVYGTDVNGTILAATDGVTYEVQPRDRSVGQGDSSIEETQRKTRQ